MSLIRKNSNPDWLETFGWLPDTEGPVGRLFSEICERGDAFTPAVDLMEDEANYYLKADLPGLQKEDIEVSVCDNTLTFKGERKEEVQRKGKNHYCIERRLGSFQRVLELPAEVDAAKIKAVFKNGVLDLTLPKAESAKPRQIKVEIQ